MFFSFSILNTKFVEEAFACLLRSNTANMV